MKDEKKERPGYNYTGMCDVYHKVAVIGLDNAGFKVIKSLLKMEVDAVDIVAVDAFDPHKFSVKRFLRNKTHLEEAFPEEMQYPGIVGIPEVGDWITNHYTDDLAYAPVAACQLAIIAINDINVTENRFSSSEQMVKLARFGMKYIFTVDEKSFEKSMEAVKAILPFLA